MPMSKMVVGNCNVLSNPYQETRFQTDEKFNYTIVSLVLKTQKLHWKTTERWYHITYNQSTFEKKPFSSKLPDKLERQILKLYYNIGEACASPNAIRKQLNIPTILG